MRLADEIKTIEEASRHRGAIPARVRSQIIQGILDEKTCNNLRGAYEKVREKSKQLGEDLNIQWTALPEKFSEAIIKFRGYQQI